MVFCMLLAGVACPPSAQARPKARIGIWRDSGVPVKNSAPSSPTYLAMLLQAAGYEVQFLSTEDLAKPEMLKADNLEMVVLPYGSAFPYEAIEPMRAYLQAGGSFFSTGGYVFDDLYCLKPVAQRGFRSGFEDGEPAGWAPREGQAAQPGVSFQRVADVKRTGGFSYRITVSPDARKGWYVLSREVADTKPGDWVRGQAYIRTENIHDGSAYLTFEFLDAKGKRLSVAHSETNLKGTTDWTLRSCSGETPKGASRVLFNCVTYGSGSAWFDDAEVEVADNRVLNTRQGYGAGAGILHTRPDQVGAFDASWPLSHVAYGATSGGQRILDEKVRLEGKLEGWAASALLTPKMWDCNPCRRWMPLLDGFDSYGRLRGGIGALVFNYAGPFKGSAWAFFGVNSQDLFDSRNEAMGRAFLRVVDRMLSKVFLHDLTSNFHCYRQGEQVALTVNASNLGKDPADVEVRVEILDSEGAKALHTRSKSLRLDPGATSPVEVTWKPDRFGGDLYRYRAVLLSGGKVTDEMTNAFLVWSDEVVAKGPALRFQDNYLCIGNRPTLLCGSNHYSVLFQSLNQSPERWDKDFRVMRDNGVNILRILHLTGQAGEKKPGLAMPDLSHPPEWLLRRFDALVQLSQKYQVALFLSAHDHIKLELSDADLAAEQRWCEMLAARYAKVPGLFWDVQNEPFVFAPNAAKDPDCEFLYNRYLTSQYRTTENLRAAWGEPYGNVELGKAPLPGDKMWHLAWDDRSALDFERARVWVLERWIAANVQALRKGDPKKPITVGHLPMETAAERWLGNDALDFADFHAYAEGSEIPKKLRMIDQRILGRSMSIGEFGVNFHPGMYRANGFRKASWIVEPPQAVEQFLEVTHEAFGMGGSFVANWLWSDSEELIFSMGLIHAHRHEPRDILRVYRNCSLFFRQVKPRFVSPRLCFVIADNHRLGGEAKRVTEAIMNGLDMLLKCHVEFSVINESGLGKLPAGVRALVYPIPFCPSDETYTQLCEFVRKGGALYISGDISYDPSRRRTRTNRLEELCGVRFVKENYPHILFEKGAPASVAEMERRPCIEVDPITAEAVGDDEGAHPLTVANRLGQGLVYFTTDPVELYAEPTRTAGYRDFLAAARIPWAEISPDKPTLHVHRLSTVEGGDLHVVFNGEADTYERVVLTDMDPNVSVDVHARKPAALVRNSERKIVAAESQGDVICGPEKLIESNLHSMVMALDGRPIKESAALLLMPFGPGAIKIRCAFAGGAASAAGEMRDGRWAPLETMPSEGREGMLSLVIADAQALGLILLAPKGAEADAVKRLEKLIALQVE